MCDLCDKMKRSREILERIADAEKKLRAETVTLEDAVIASDQQIAKIAMSREMYERIKQLAHEQHDAFVKGGFVQPLPPNIDTGMRFWGIEVFVSPYLTGSEFVPFDKDGKPILMKKQQQEAS